MALMGSIVGAPPQLQSKFKAKAGYKHGTGTCRHRSTPDQGRRQHQQSAPMGIHEPPPAPNTHYRLRQQPPSMYVTRK